jgi:AraC-like DNA-binding protein
MLLTDLVSSISKVFPQLIASSARRLSDEQLFESSVGFGFFRPSYWDAVEPFALEDSEGWSRLRSTTLGLLGTGPIGQVVARIACENFGADVVYHHAVPFVKFGNSASRRTFSDVIAARALCVVLPWPGDLPAQIQQHKVTRVSPDNVLVLWRRSPPMERAIDYLGQHFVEQVQLSTLANVAGISKFHLVRQFTAIVGISPHRFQLLLRLSQAKAMLREGTCITQIAQSVGFGDHSHLDRRFRNLTGLTPSQYQRTLER